ncbi:aquaporin [Buchnera aphidicola]|uniref:aquaporin n=1 Tax=Buchnera aphidicola TaxID=9 RepID=UPI0034649B81
MKHHLNHVYFVSFFSLYVEHNHLLLVNLFIELLISAIFIIFIIFLNEYKDYFILNHIDCSPLIIGLVLIIINNTIGNNIVFCLNPALDLSPKIFSLLNIYLRNLYLINIPNLFSFFFIPIIGPILGFIIGVYGYNFIHKIFK